MKKSLTKLGLAALALSVMGCSVMVRSPDQYREDTRAAIESNRPAIEACYTGALQNSKELTGRVAITFSVQPETGVITNTQVDPDQTTAPDQLAQCVVQAVEGLAIAPPDEKEGQATFYFDFVAQPSTAAG